MLSGAEKIISLYNRHAADYDADRARSTPGLERRWLDRFLAFVEPGGKILDLGCSVGRPIAEYMMACGLRIIGVDSSPAMIRICTRRFPDADWIVADMRTLPLSGTIAGIIACDSFLHLTAEDQRDMFGVFAKHAGRGTALMFTSGPNFGEAIGEYHGEPLYHACLAPEEYRALTRSARFDVVAHIVNDPSAAGIRFGSPAG